MAMQRPIKNPLSQCEVESISQTGHRAIYPLFPALTDYLLDCDTVMQAKLHGFLLGIKFVSGNLFIVFMQDNTFWDLPFND
jgi:hypothetical protein